MSDTVEPAKRGYVGQWAILAGVVLAIVGGLVMNGARKARESALRVLDYSHALGVPSRTSPELESAITQGHVGLGMLIFGLALALVGLVLAAFKK